MKIAKALVLLLIAGVIGLVFFVFSGGQETINQRQSNPTVTSSSRGDDPTYAEEVKQLTALTRKYEEDDRKKELDYKSKFRDLKLQIEDAKRSNRLSSEETQRIEKMEKQLSNLGSTIRNSLEPLKSTVSKLADKQTKQVGKTGVQSTMPGYVRIRPFGVQTASIGVSGTNPLSSVGALSGSLSKSTQQRAGSKANAKAEKIPVYTLHDAAILSNSRSVTPIIGRVPNGGDVRDPFRFRVVTGGKNIMANGHRVPGVKDAIWSGYAVGVREESCVRGYIDTVTFVFEDGTIFTDSRTKATSVSKTTKVTESLAYLTDPGGNQCIKGTLVSNASSYLRDRSVAAFAEAMALGYASAQTTVDRASSGSLSAYVDGDVIKYGLGRGLSGSAAEVATYLRQRQEDAFDVIYFPSDKTLQIMVEQQIEIDYDPAGRKVNYHYSQVNQNENALLD